MTARDDDGRDGLWAQPIDNGSARPSNPTQAHLDAALKTLEAILPDRPLALMAFDRQGRVDLAINCSRQDLAAALRQIAEGLEQRGGLPQ